MARSKKQKARGKRQITKREYCCLPFAGPVAAGRLAVGHRTGHLAAAVHRHVAAGAGR